MTGQVLPENVRVVRYDDAMPTQRALAARIQAQSKLRLRLQASELPGTVSQPLRILDLRGQVPTPTAAPSPQHRVLSLSLQHSAASRVQQVGVELSSLLKCCLRAMPQLERVSVLYRNGQEPPQLPKAPIPGGAKLRLSAHALRNAADLRSLLGDAPDLRPHLLILNEGAGLDELAPELLSVSQSLRVPVATNIPWLANSGATIAVTPRMDTLATVLAHWLDAESPRSFHWPGVNLRTLNVQRLQALGRPIADRPKPKLLATFDVIIRDERGVR